MMFIVEQKINGDGIKFLKKTKRKETKMCSKCISYFPLAIQEKRNDPL